MFLDFPRLQITYRVWFFYTCISNYSDIQVLLCTVCILKKFPPDYTDKNVFVNEQNNRYKVQKKTI